MCLKKEKKDKNIYIEIFWKICIYSALTLAVYSVYVWEHFKHFGGRRIIG